MSKKFTTPKAILRPRKGTKVFLVGYGIAVAVVCVMNTGGMWKFQTPEGHGITMCAGAVELLKA
jgi:hypothetical protein